MSGTARPRPPTMADVAGLAGVSHQTVSRVLNGEPSVRPETAERVRRAIADLGYRRNLAARRLAARRSGLIGLTAFGLSQLGPREILLAIEHAAADEGYEVAWRTMQQLTSEAVGRAVDHLLEQGVEAVVVIVPHASVTRFLQTADLDVPLVVVEGDLGGAPLTVALDNALGARLATRHLLELGHHTVTHLAGPPGWSEAAARVEGWRAELQDWGRPVPPLRWAGDWSPASGYAAGASLARDPDVTAVFAANDQMALGLLAALHGAGRRVPDEVSVVGFDDIPEASYLVPSLTTIHQDFAELGRRAMRVVGDALAGVPEPRAEAVQPSLVVRGSTAPPPTP